MVFRDKLIDLVNDRKFFTKYVERKQHWKKHYFVIPNEIQLTLEQHEFELHGSIYMWIFFNKYILQNYTIQGGLNPSLVESVGG